MLVFLGYLVLGVIIIALMKYPYYGILLTFLTKPIIDMFWESKYYGFVSPLLIAAIVIPLLAILKIKFSKSAAVHSKHDKVIFAYIFIFGLLTMLKIVNNPKYLFNSIESFVRILSVTSFYFIGQAYFRDEKRKKYLTLAIVFSTLFPFLLTIYQILSGQMINKPMYWEEGGRAAFYLSGRHDLQRISGVYEGVYELAFLGLFVALILIAVRQSRVRFPMWGYLTLGLGIYFLYFTYSRSAWSLFIFSLFVFSVFRKKYTFVAMILIVFILLYALVPAVQYRFEDEIGFIRGEKALGQVGYGRGNVWIRTWDDFNKQDVFSRLVGNYGLGNPENQFFGLLVWFGYLGLFTFLGLITYLSWQLWKHRRRVQNDNSLNANIRFLFIAIIIGGYWVASLGNFFMTMISTQWVLWVWTGILLNDPGYRGRAAASKKVVPDLLSNSLRRSNQYKPFTKNA